MKKYIFWTTALVLFLSFSVAGQNTLRSEVREQVKQYFDEQIAPLLVVQQTKYINALSQDEKTVLADAKLTMGNNPNKRGQGKGHNSGINRTNCFDLVTEITTNHANENEAYQVFIDEHKAAWVSDIKAIHEENDVNQMRNADGNSGSEFWLERIESPEALLMMNPDQPFNRGMGVNKGQGRGNGKGQGNRQGCGYGNGRGIGQGNGQGNGQRGQGVRCKSGGFNGNMNPEMRAEMKSFMQEDVIPAIAAQRIAFDKNLSDDEKEIISLARQKKEVRKAMFKAWHDSEDFVPGERRNDPNFDAMRADMQKSMQAVRTIAIDHKIEIRQSLDKIDTYKQAWKDKMDVLVEDNGQNRASNNKAIRGMKKWNTPMAFLLFDPAKSDSPDLLTNELSSIVTVFPNPIVNTGTVKISNAINKNVKIVLFTKEGTQLEEVFNGLVNTDHFSVPFSTSQWEAGLYLMKITLDGEVITRKVMIEH